MKLCQYCNEPIIKEHSNRKLRKDKVFCSQKCHDRFKYEKSNKPVKQFKDDFGLNKYAFRGLQKKLMLIDLFGGKCEKCGYDKNISAFDFHHKDKYEKTFDIKIQILNYKNDNEILEEVMKCMLLCSNCHRELHYPHMDINHVRRVVSLENKLK